MKNLQHFNSLNDIDTARIKTNNKFNELKSHLDLYEQGDRLAGLLDELDTLFRDLRKNYMAAHVGATEELGVKTYPTPQLQNKGGHHIENEYEVNVSMTTEERIALRSALRHVLQDTGWREDTRTAAQTLLGKIRHAMSGNARGKDA